MSRIMDEMIREYIDEYVEKARNKVKNEVGKESAQRMLKDNLPIEKISKYSGLSVEEVKKLMKQMGD